MVERKIGVCGWGVSESWLRDGSIQTLTSFSPISSNLSYSSRVWTRHAPSMESIGFLFVRPVIGCAKSSFSPCYDWRPPITSSGL